MCLGIPGKIIKIDGNMATVDIEGVSRQISLQLVENIALGDYVLLHSGFAIQKMDEKDAQETLDLLHQIVDLNNGK